jgi:hypothetical protein
LWPRHPAKSIDSALLERLRSSNCKVFAETILQPIVNQIAESQSPTWARPGASLASESVKRFLILKMSVRFDLRKASF